MARKLLILIRESGIPFEQKNIHVDKIISNDAQNAKTVDEFFAKLKEDDKRILELKNKAFQNNCVLSFIAKYEKGEAKLSLVEIDKNHPFANLHDSENIVSFTTKNYWKNPLIIRGQGAGAEFTAVGILSDVLRISNYLS
jgi:aspartokinase/homoserine dehydrogenase 1